MDYIEWNIEGIYINISTSAWGTGGLIVVVVVAVVVVGQEKDR
jgi:hypothetical protein